AFIPEVEGLNGVPGAAPGNLSAEERAQAQADIAAAESTPPASPATASANEQSSESEASDALSLAVDDISFTNIVLSYRDRSTGTELEAELAQMNLSQVNLKGEPIGVNLKWQASLRD